MGKSRAMLPGFRLWLTAVWRPGVIEHKKTKGVSLARRTRGISALLAGAAVDFSSRPSRSSTDTDQRLPAFSLSLRYARSASACLLINPRAPRSPFPLASPRVHRVPSDDCPLARRLPCETPP